MFELFSNRLFVFALLGGILMLSGFWGIRKDGLAARLLGKHRDKVNKIFKIPILLVIILFVLLAICFILFITWAGTVALLMFVFNVPQLPAIIVSIVIMLLLLVLIVARGFSNRVQKQLFYRRRHENEKDNEKDR